MPMVMVVKPDRAPETHSVHLGRQAIYDSVGDVVAYELLFRDRSDAVAAVHRDSYATAQVLLAAWTGFGRRELLGARPAFVNLTDPFVRGDLPTPLSPSQVGVEIPADGSVDDGLVAAVAALAEREFTIVLDNFRPGEDRSALLPYATYCKIDFLGIDEEAVARATEQLAAYPHIEWIAYRLESTEAIDLAMRHGCHLFQGNGLGHPHVLTTRVPTVDPARAADLFTELTRAAPDLARITELVAADAGLAVGIRRAATSDRSDGAAVTVERAVTTLGVTRIADWVRLIRFVADPAVPPPSLDSLGAR